MKRQRGIEKKALWEGRASGIIKETPVEKGMSDPTGPLEIGRELCRRYEHKRRREISLATGSADELNSL